MIRAGILALIILLGLSVKPAYRKFREYRIDRNLEAARVAARSENWGAARDHARSVLLARQDFDAYRIWARALGKLGAPGAFVAAAEVFTDRRAKREDLLEALEVMGHQAPQAVAFSAYACLPEEFRNQAEFRAAIVPLLIRRGQVELAESCLREVAQPDDDPKVKLELVRVLCCRPTPARVAEARRIFADLVAANADEESLAALVILSDAPGGLAEGDPLPVLPEWLRNQPKATTIHHLLGMHPVLRARPESAARLYDAAVERFLTIDPGVLGNWLVRHEQAELAADILKKPAATRSDAYLARLNALFHLKNDAELVAALGEPPPSADLVEVEIVQARLAMRNGDLITASAAWTRALNHAAYDTTRNRCIEIARIAEQCGARDAAEDAWVAAVRLGWGQLPLYNDLLPVFSSLVAKGRSEDLLAMFRTLLRFEPANPELINNAYYFALIHNVLPPAQVIEALTKIIERNDKPVYNSTLMLAEMLDGRHADALALLPKVRDGKGVDPIMIAALEGTARILAGETEKGNSVLDTVNWRALMSQERVVFRSLLVKAENSKPPMPELATPGVAADPDQLPAWRKAVERFEKDRAGDVLPALMTPKTPGVAPPVPAKAADPEQVPAWRKAREQQEKAPSANDTPAPPPADARQANQPGQP